MTPRQKRAYNHAARAIARLSAEVIDDFEAFNASVGMIARGGAAMVGGAAAAHGMSVEDLHEATVRFSRHVQENAASTYAEVLARQAAGETVN